MEVDALIVDEGQDFEPRWSEILRLFLKPDADLLWLEDLDQIHSTGQATNSLSLPTKACRRSSLASELVPIIVRRRRLRATFYACCPFDFVPSNPLPGLGVGVAAYKLPEDQSRRVAAIVTELIRTGFRHSDVVILSMRGLARATFARQKRIGTFTLSRPTGEYDLLGNQLFENGQLRFDTVYRFKGQQAPAIILTDVDPNQERPDHTAASTIHGNDASDGSS